jgi:hypothetical protein
MMRSARGLYVVRSGFVAGVGSALTAEARAAGRTHYSADPPAAGVLDDVFRVRFSPFNTWYRVSSW